MKALQTPTLDEIVRLDEGSIGVMKTIVGLHGRKRAAEITGLTFHQLKESYAKGAGTRQNLRAIPADAYRRACEALGISQPEGNFSFRAHRPTKKDREELYVQLTPEIREEVRRFIKGRTVKEAAGDLGMNRSMLQPLYNPRTRVRNIPVAVLEKIRTASSPANPAGHYATGNGLTADEHPMLHMAGYRRIREKERQLIRQFLTGGTIEDAVSMIQYFGLKPAYWNNSYISNIAHSLMATVVRIRIAAGYYDMIAGASEEGIHWQEIHMAGHIRNTASRRQLIGAYVESFNPGKKCTSLARISAKYAAAAKKLGVEAIQLKRIVWGNNRRIQAALYLRVLEASGAVELSEEDSRLKPYVGRAQELEKMLETYSLKALTDSFVKPLLSQFRVISPYIKEPEAGIAMLLQEAASGRSPDALIQIMQGYATGLSGAITQPINPLTASEFASLIREEPRPVKVAAYFQRIGAYLKSPDECREMFLQKLGEAGDKDRLMRQLDEYVRILERNSAVFAANRIPKSPITSSDFAYFFGINRADKNSHTAK